MNPQAGKFKFYFIRPLSIFLVASGCNYTVNKIAPAPVDQQAAALLQPTFQSIKENILDPKCIRCHSPGGETARIPLLTVNDLLNSPLDIVIPGNAEESGLIIALDPKYGSSKPMPPAKSGLQPVSQKDLEIISLWIQNGAKD